MRNRKQQLRQPRRPRPGALLETLEGRALMSGAGINGVVHHDFNQDSITDEGSTTPLTRVYIDLNENARRDKGEFTTTTDEFGNYSFRNLPGGTFHVRIELPDGFYGVNDAARDGKLVRIPNGNATLTVATMQIAYEQAPWRTVGQNAQHTGISPFRGGTLSSVSQVTVTDTSPTAPSDTGFKFGTPLVTRFNTVLVPVFLPDNKFGVRAYSRFTGGILWTFQSDFIVPPSVQLNIETVGAIFQPAMDKFGRLFVPGEGGTLHMIAQPDQNGFLDADKGLTVSAKRMVFYGRRDYVKNRALYRKSIFINTPLTVDQNGNVYFGVEAGPKNHTKLGPSLVKLRPDGQGGRVGARVVAGSAPAVSNDGRFVYVATEEEFSDSSNATAPRLRRFESGSLAQAGSVILKDPSQKNKALHLTPGGTSSVTVAPDGDVYYVIPSRRNDLAAVQNGWLMRFSGDLTQQKLAGVAAVNQTVSIVPKAMMTNYHGPSSYLVLASYNKLFNYTLGSQPGSSHTGRLAIFDPAKAANVKVHGLQTMRELAGITADVVTVQDQQGNVTQVDPGEWITRPAVVDPSSGSVFAMDTGDRVTRWSVANPRDIGNAIQAASVQGADPALPGLIIGPDGQIYVIANGALYAGF